MAKEAIPRPFEPGPLEGSHVQRRWSCVTAAFSVGEYGAGLRRRWGQWEGKTGSSPLLVERRSVLPVVKRKHYEVPVYVLK